MTEDDYIIKNNKPDLISSFFGGVIRYAPAIVMVPIGLCAMLSGGEIFSSGGMTEFEYIVIILGSTLLCGLGMKWMR